MSESQKFTVGEKMKKTLLTLFILLTFLVSLQAAEKKVTRLGGHPFYKSKNLTPDELKKIAVDRAGDVKMGFEEAGYGGLVYPFLEQIQKSELKETTIEPGDKLMWMLAKRGKKVTVGHDIVWAGKKPVPAYTFKIAREENIYEFVIPKICANISLKSIFSGQARSRRPNSSTSLTIRSTRCVLSRTMRSKRSLVALLGSSRSNSPA